MKTLPVGEFKSQFSAIINLIQQGKEVGLSYGKKKEKIAVLVPISNYKKKKKIKLGILEGKANFKIKDDFKMTDEELLAS